jgi:hypothetical protein
VLEFDHLAADRLRETGDGFASRSQRDVELAFYQPRAGKQAKGSRHLLRAGLAIEHGQQGDAHAGLRLAVRRMFCF